MPLEKLAVLENFVRQSKQRKVPVNAEFVGAIVDTLAQQARQYQKDRTGDALAAALALEVAGEMGLAPPREGHPNVGDILAGTSRPVQLICELEDYSLWPYCLQALGKRPDAAYQLTLLLHAAPTSQLDVIAALLDQAGAAAAVGDAVAKALTSPRENLDIFLWLWVGSKKPVTGLPGKVEMFSKVLNVVAELDHDFQIGHAERKASKQKVRWAMATADYASYRQALREMTEAVAGTFKSRVQRSMGLAESVRDDMISLLRENFYSLFVRAKVEPWLDETTIWTTPAALDKRQAALKDIIEVKMLENARAIGEAAAHGDLSENSEWKFAIEERDLLQARAAKLQEEIVMARVIQPEDVPADYVGVGSKVILERIGDNKRLELTFLGPWDSDLEKGQYSYQTVLGQELMGKTIGEGANVKFEGLEGEYRITAIESGIPARKEGH
jgi:transcription elongation GreA/GreB family factor